MTVKPIRLLIVSPQVTQNPEPFKLLNSEPGIELLVAYCSLPGKVEARGEEYLNKAMFDTPVLQGYPWTLLQNIAPRPSLDSAFGLINPGAVSAVKKADAVVVYGHYYLTCLFAIAAAKLFRRTLILGSDAVTLGGPETSRIKRILKQMILPVFYRFLADAVIVPSSASKRFMRSLGVAESRIHLTPYVVDNAGIAARAAASDRTDLRRSWGVPPEAFVLTFVSKLLPRKRPQDVLAAAARLGDPKIHVVIVGDGPLRAELTALAEQLGLSERVHWLGFVPYSELPGVYAASDLLVHPAEREPYGLAVNEAMVCGCPVVVSDAVGAGEDLVIEGVTGFTYPSGNIEALTAAVRSCADDPELLRRLRAGALHRIATWSSTENAESVARAVRAGGA